MYLQRIIIRNDKWNGLDIFNLLYPSFQSFLCTLLLSFCKFTLSLHMQHLQSLPCKQPLNNGLFQITTAMHYGASAVWHGAWRNKAHSIIVLCIAMHQCWVKTSHDLDFSSSWSWSWSWSWAMYKVYGTFIFVPGLDLCTSGGHFIKHFVSDFHWLIL